MKGRKALAGMAVVAAFALGAFLIRAIPESVSPPFSPHVVGQSPWFKTVASGITGNVAESAATPFSSETGIIQIAIKVTSGSATAGTITVHTQLADGDTTYVAIPTATCSLITSESLVSDKITVGTGYHKLVVSGATGTFNFDLGVKDF